MSKAENEQPLRQLDSYSEGSMQPMPWWWAAIATTTSIVLGVGAWLIVWLIAKHNATLKVEAIKVGLSVTAGAGAAYALLLAFRRQMHTEYVARDTAFDAEQRRITELYTKAVEQLGNEKAAVRLGGLYALERLGQSNIELRPTVVDVICAYLRMPYYPPENDNSSATARSKSNKAGISANIHDQDSTQQELLVRMTAQQLLARHLDDPEFFGDPVRYWKGVVVDLRGANLINAEFSRCRFDEADFSDAIFTGHAWFDEATFTDVRCDFARAQFKGEVNFLTEFEEGASFTGTHFNGIARFRECGGDNDIVFDDAWFHGDATFLKAKFRSGSHFKRTHFCGAADFREVYFKFGIFDDTEFTGSEPDLTNATAGLEKARLNIWPNAWTAIPVEGKKERLQLVRDTQEAHTGLGPGMAR